MKTLIEKIIQFRNPIFKFDKHLNSFVLFQFVFNQAICLIRGFRMLLFFKNPNGMLLGRNVKFFNQPQIWWGRYLKLGDNVFVSALGKVGVVFGNNVGIGANSRIVVSTSLNNLGSFIKIGNNVGIGENAYLGGAGGLEIGKDCIVGQFFSCHPENHIFSNHQIPIRLQSATRKGIKIGDNCWIGSKVTILDGVEIGNNCVIAAGSVVTKSMPSNTVIGGIPARIMKDYTFDLQVA